MCSHFIGSLSFLSITYYFEPYSYAVLLVIVDFFRILSFYSSPFAVYKASNHVEQVLTLDLSVLYKLFLKDGKVAPPKILYLSRQGYQTYIEFRHQSFHTFFSLLSSLVPNFSLQPLLEAQFFFKPNNQSIYAYFLQSIPGLQFQSLPTTSASFFASCKYLLGVN